VKLRLTEGEVIMVYFKLKSQHLSGTQKNNEKDLATIVSALAEGETGYDK
jgi:hypothetical protein